ncbi:hypothetical protein [Campylobacter estrildidarum]|uniref:Uncharacterized protein n=1 Tax=Campylobacter estrildidarum TaxID=2510189 RepID=A0A4U7BC35_9BACT|nr:hypothetical protein [Campylobacter estrildidarum]TKX28893.1 hypothetical protein CQA69_07745 [Campylobacter estrildidarum]
MFDEWELERQRQINLQNLRREEEERLKKHGTLEGTMLEIVFNLIALAISLAFIIVVTTLKWIFYFIVFLRAKFFIKWNWYVKVEKAVISACATICAALLYTIFILPIIYLFKWWELWLVIGFIYLNYCYGKV